MPVTAIWYVPGAVVFVVVMVSEGVAGGVIAELGLTRHSGNGVLVTWSAVTTQLNETSPVKPVGGSEVDAGGGRPAGVHSRLRGEH